jgi:hypothetical protein
VRFVQLKPEKENSWLLLSNPIRGRVRTFNPQQNDNSLSM